MTEYSEGMRYIFGQPEDTVIAVRVRSCDYPQVVANDIEELVANFPGEWEGEQCDGCGCSTFTIRPKPGLADWQAPDHPLRWECVCAGSDDTADYFRDYLGADEDQVRATRTGCGASYDLSYMREREVQF